MTIVDATRRFENEDHKDLLIGEVHHRIKNLMAMTQALARQTTVEGRTAVQYRDALLGRFEALSKSLDAFTEQHASRLPDLAHSILEPFSGQRDRVAVADGPQVLLRPNQAAPLGMILHELATNALKYGALSVPDGRVKLMWDVRPNSDGLSQMHLC